MSSLVFVTALVLLFGTIVRVFAMRYLSQFLRARAAQNITQATKSLTLKS
jgi:hypothetical protein